MHRVLDDAAVLHLVPEVVAFTAALANTGEDRVAFVELGDAVDQLLDDNCLADTRAAEDAGLATLGEWRHQVNDLHAGLEDLSLGRLLNEGRGKAMDGIVGIRDHGRALVQGLPQDVEKASQRRLAHRDRDGGAGGDNIHAAPQAIGRGHGNGTHAATAHLLLHFADQHTTLFGSDLYRVIDLGQLTFLELSIHDRAKDGDDFANSASICAVLGHSTSSTFRYSNRWIKQLWPEHRLQQRYQAILW